ncbi:SDR family oxidoreductase [bacterium]|nr:SDR family oxidoreductase [bacterium]NCT21078.1 SDR family oxidoreductase [bacterium]OIO87452.1 MAG: hypothetical protein AUK01_00065 [Anaerolineae bacterium CG2_30_57_67]
MERIFLQAREFTPSLDALVNNAAYQVAKPLLETSVEEWDAVMASNCAWFFYGETDAPAFEEAGGGREI